MKALRFAMIGTGFWSRFQLAGWRELTGVACVALYNRTGAKAEALAKAFGVPGVYDDPDELLKREKLDFLDIVTSGAGSCSSPARENAQLLKMLSRLCSISLMTFHSVAPAASTRFCQASRRPM